MNWLNKLVRSGPSKSAKPTNVAASPVPEIKLPAMDPMQLRQRLALAQTAEERALLECDLAAALAQTLQLPQSDDSARVRSKAVVHLSDKASALSWLVDLTDEDGLAEVALRARFAEVRLAAARRLSSTAALERVAQASRDKDKGVYRHCSTALHERQAASDCAVRAAALEHELEAMLAVDPASAARLVELEKEFRQLAAVDLSRCAELIGQLRLRVQEQSRHMQKLHARHLAVQALTAELAHQPVLLEDAWQQYRSRWNELTSAGDAWPAWLAEHKELISLQRLQVEIESRLADAREDLERFRDCMAFLETHGQDESMGVETRSAWEALPKPDNPQLRAELQSRWEACLSRLAKKVEAQSPPAAPAARVPRDNKLLLKLIGQLEDAIEQGHLSEASKLDAEIKTAESTDGLPHSLAQRVARVRAQLLKLRGWARWGSDQARQQLILKAEQLAQGNDDVASLSKAIAELREEWKSLDAHGASARLLWEQFDAAVEKAYAPVAVHRADLAAMREAARVAKEALCLDWESWLGGISWEHADIKVIQAMRQEICDTWRAAALAAGREERILRKRFDALLADLDGHIEAARCQEISRCELLIAAAEGLRERANLRQAIDSVKALQQRWRDEAVSVRLSRAQSEQLWQRFRSACNEVFTRRDEEKTQQKAQLARRSEEAQTRLADLEATLAVNDIVKLQQALLDFRTAWREVKAGAMTAPAKEVLQRAEARLRALQASQRRAPYLLMAQKMALVEQIECAAAAGEIVETHLHNAQATWQTLPRLPEKFEQPLARRLGAAPGATASDLAAGHKLREELLLDMEIALGLRSPNVHDQLRRTRHLQMLQQKFRRDQSPLADLDKLIVSWHATVAAADDQHQQRMACILQALEDAPSLKTDI